MYIGRMRSFVLVLSFLFVAAVTFASGVSESVVAETDVEAGGLVEVSTPVGKITVRQISEERTARATLTMTASIDEELQLEGSSKDGRAVFRVVPPTGSNSFNFGPFESVEILLEVPAETSVRTGSH